MKTAALIVAMLVAAALATVWDAPADAPAAPAQDVGEALGDPVPAAARDGHRGIGQDGLPPGHPPVALDAQIQSAAPMTAIELPAGAITVAQVVRDARALAGKRVRVAAKVVKRTAGVLGRTWLHVQDGSGSAERGDHDLVVTTEALPVLGEVVELEGAVVCDKDLGSGYRYEVLIEDATILPAGERHTQSLR